MSAKPFSVPAQSRIVDFGQKPAPVPQIEVLDTHGLARKLTTPDSWVRSRVQPRCPVEERIPHVRFGRYVRFLWNSPEMVAWLESRKAY
jgi:hypothetical protein